MGRASVRPHDGNDKEHDYDGQTLILKSSRSFTETELRSFNELSEFAPPNPRKIKRISNSYICSRLLLPKGFDSADFRDKLLAWIFLCELWPIRTSWILQVVEDNQQVLGVAADEMERCTLFDYYFNHVDKLVFSTMNSKQLGTPVKQDLADAYSLDCDPELFRKLLRQKALAVGDIGDLRITRQADKLCSYCVNLSPDIRMLVSKIARHRVDKDTLMQVTSKAYCAITHLWGKSIFPGQPSNRKATEASRKANQDACEANLAPNTAPGSNDHINYTAYAEALAQLVVSYVEVPCVFGLYGAWGTGKSFMMNKITTYVKACAISRLVHAHGEDEAHFDLLSQIKVMAQNDQQIDLLFKWLKTGCNCEAVKGLSTGNLKQLDQKIVTQNWNARQKAPQVSDFDLEILEVIGYAFHLLTYAFNVLRWLILSCWRASRGRGKKSARGLELLRHVWKETPTKVGAQDMHYDYEFIWLDSWVFCGSDNLWAGLVLKLHEAVETYYGPSYAFAEHHARLLKATTKLSLAIFVICIGIAFLAPTDWMELHNELVGIVANPTNLLDLTARFAGLCVSGFSGFTAVKQVQTLLNLPTTPSQGLQVKVRKDNFRQMLGYMDLVKKELTFLANLLENPESVPSLWDYLLPETWNQWHVLRRVATPVLKRLKAAFRRLRNRSPRKCRIVIFVDELDRCPPKEIVEVLQALMLLSKDTPFVTFLSVDPQIVVSAIEVSNSQFYGMQDISPHEYLSKIVQVPFAIPRISDHCKQRLFQGYLTGQPERDYVEFVDKQGDGIRYELSGDRAKIRLVCKAPTGEEKLRGEVNKLRYADYVLSDGSGRRFDLPQGSESRVLRQLSSLARRRRPPCDFELGSEVVPALH